VLFAETLWSLIDTENLSPDDEYDLGVRIFDNLTYGQKVSVLSIVGNGLLRQDIPSVELTAVLEGAIASVYRHLHNLITIEIDMPESGTRWREKVIAARMEGGEEEGVVSSTYSDDLVEWNFELECLIGSIVWDYDYDDEHLFADLEPRKAKAFKQLAGISDDYYISVAEDLNEEQIKTALTELNELCRTVVEEKQ